MDCYYHNVSSAALIQSTRALLIFCHCHDDTRVVHLGELEKCLTALNVGDFKTAHEHFKNIPFGGMGGFSDWWPPAVYPAEDPEYVGTVFDALCERWGRLMAAANGDK
jgi:hypothetical protein